MIQNKKCIMIIAGETSGDQHGAKLVDKMLAKDPELFFCGMGGEALKAAGVKDIIDSSKISIVGITEIFSKLFDIIKNFFRAKRLLKNFRPHLLILIDFPEFNLALAKTAKKLGIPILYYISPQIWAWRSKRVKKIKRLVDHIAVILPFEEEFYRNNNVPVTYVGHPLLDTDQKFDAEIEEDRIIIGLVPGSREKEITNHLPVMLKAASMIHKNNKKIELSYAMAPGLDQGNILKIIRENADDLKIEIVTDGIEKVLKKSTLVIAGSGTATLQTALFGVPMIIIYKMSGITYMLAKALIKIENISLVNLIAGEKIVPELIQEKAVPESIAAEAEKILNNHSEAAKIREKLLSLGRLMGEKGASEKVAEIAFGMMRRERSPADLI